VKEQNEMGMKTYMGIENVCWVEETFDKIAQNMKLII
jgi:hypothetical protein